MQQPIVLQDSSRLGVARHKWLRVHAAGCPARFREKIHIHHRCRAQYCGTNVDYPVTYNGATFLADGPLVQGLKYKSSVGLEVDKPQITIAARPTNTINGSPFLWALGAGAFDRQAVYRDRVFMTSPNGVSSATCACSR